MSCCPLSRQGFSSRCEHTLRRLNPADGVHPGDYRYSFYERGDGFINLEQRPLALRRIRTNLALSDTISLINGLVRQHFSSGEKREGI